MQYITQYKLHTEILSIFKYEHTCYVTTDITMTSARIIMTPSKIQSNIRHSLLNSTLSTMTFVFVKVYVLRIYAQKEESHGEIMSTYSTTEWLRLDPSNVWNHFTQTCTLRPRHLFLDPSLRTKKQQQARPEISKESEFTAYRLCAAFKCASSIITPNTTTYDFIAMSYSHKRLRYI